jgi:hypothetical protein
MNSLSWLLYGADASAKLGVALGTGTIVGALLVPGSFIAMAWVHDFVTDDEATLRGIRDKWKVGATLAIVCAVLWAVVPSRNTIMLIAASEVGETVLASPQAQTIGGEAGELAADSLRVLRKFINDQLDGPASEETP